MKSWKLKEDPFQTSIDTSPSNKNRKSEHHETNGSPRKLLRRNNSNNTSTANSSSTENSILNDTPTNSKTKEKIIAKKSKSVTSKEIPKNNDRLTRSKSLSPVSTKAFYKINLRKKTGDGKQIYKCKDCKKAFGLLHLYNKHRLSHAKSKTVVINLLRHKLPKRTRASEFLKSETRNSTKRPKAGLRKNKQNAIIAKRSLKLKDENKKIREKKSLEKKAAENKSANKVEDLDDSTAKKRSRRISDRIKDVETVGDNSENLNMNGSGIENKRSKRSLDKNVDESKTERRHSGRNLDKVNSVTNASKKSPVKKRKYGDNGKNKKKRRSVGSNDDSRRKTTPAKSEDEEESFDESSETEYVDKTERRKKLIQKEDVSERVCITCNESFLHLYEYKKHLLRHEKVQSHLVVNLINYVLPEAIKASKFTLCHADKFTREYHSKAIAESLLRKYIGEENLKSLNLNSNCESDNSKTENIEQVSIKENVETPALSSKESEDQKKIEVSTAEEADQETVTEVQTQESDNLDTNNEKSEEAIPPPVENKENEESTALIEESTKGETTNVVASELVHHVPERVVAEVNEDTSPEQSEDVGAKKETIQEKAVEAISTDSTQLTESQESKDSSEATVIIGEDDTENHENVTEEEQALKDQDVTKIVENDKNLSEAAAVVCDEIANSFCEESDHDVERLLDEPHLSQESVYSDIIEATPEEKEGGENANECIVNEPPRETEEDLQMVEDISSISNFIQETMNSPFEQIDKRKSDSPVLAQPKKKVRFALTSEDNSSEENNDFSLLMPTD